MLGPPESTSKARDMRDMGVIPGLGRSPGEGTLATHTSSLAWRIPWTEEPGRLQSMELDTSEQLSYTHEVAFRLQQQHWVLATDFDV